MIFTKDEIGQKIFATLPGEDETDAMECQLSICGNPLCMCNRVTVNLFDVSDDHQSIPITSITVDVENHDVEVRPDKPDELPQHRVFDLTMNRLLEEEDYKFLYREYMLHKQHVTEEADLHALEANFPMADIEENSALMSYSDILPYTDHFFIHLDGQRYLLHDQYCVKKNCLCTNVIINCIYFGEGMGRGTEVAAYAIDYKKRQWKPLEEPDSDVGVVGNIRELKRITETSYPMWYKQTRTRHTNLKTLYGNYLKRQGFGLPQRPRMTVRVKRNDPCPCGSGQKFKKCCMSK